MKIKEPRNFNDILELQKILDNNIKNIRTRTLEDIKLSLIAEIIEFNEETKESHKTWKTKEYNREKKLEELTDVYFFFAQLMNFMNDKYEIRRCNELFKEFEVTNHEEPFELINLLVLIRILTDAVYSAFLVGLILITKAKGFTKEDILKTYFKKWQKNMERIRKEWN